MRLRILQEKDAPYMLEWMSDPELIKFFRFDAEKANSDNILAFINRSINDNQNKHFAVVDENDEYLGTISLKNIDYENKNAEYAISLRKKAIGKGFATSATKALLKIAFEELHLHKVYLNVLSENIRAIKFYEKFGFEYDGEFKEHLILNGNYKNIKWYSYMGANKCQQ